MTTSLAAEPGLKGADFYVPTALVVLSCVPLVGGIGRLLNLVSDGPVQLANARFVQAPTPIILHVLAAALYSLLGAFQFSRGLRVRFSGWHRRAGKVVVLAGLTTGSTGLWMTLMYDIPANHQGGILYGVRLLVGSAMVVSLLIGWSSILRRDVPRHEAFMIRAYALAQGAGTQALVLLPWMLISGQSGGLTRDLLMTLAWLINMILAECIIRWRAPSREPRLALNRMAAHGE